MRTAVCGRLFAYDGDEMFNYESVLAPAVIEFVHGHVPTLLTWDILVFFHRNPDAVLDIDGLASRLGRTASEVDEEVTVLCEDEILDCSGGLVRYRPTDERRALVGSFVDACQDRSQRLALISLVLH